MNTQDEFLIKLYQAFWGLTKKHIVRSVTATINGSYFSFITHRDINNSQIRELQSILDLFRSMEYKGIGMNLKKICAYNNIYEFDISFYSSIPEVEDDDLGF